MPQTFKCTRGLNMKKYIHITDGRHINVHTISRHKNDDTTGILTIC